MIFLQFVLFCSLSILLFTLPGLYFFHQSKNFGSVEKIILGTTLGYLIFTLLSYFLGILKIDFLLLPVEAPLIFLSLRNILHFKLNFTLSVKQILILTIIFCLGIAGQMAIISPSGTKKGGDLIFWSSNGHDGPWHIALMEEIKRGYPLQNPIFAGERLINYHFFSDIAPAEFSKIFKFSNLDLYFRFFPFLFSLQLGLIVYMLGAKMGNSYNCGIWSIFFVYFAGSFGYIVTWVQSHKISGESIFWATQIQSSSGNPPQIVSYVLVLTFLYLFLGYISKKEWSSFLLCVLLAGSLVEFKVYAAVVTLGSLAIVGLIQLIKDRKIHILSLFTLSILLSAILYIPNTVRTASFLIWEPWWFIRTMIVAPSKLDWLDLEHRRQTYIAEGNWKRVLQIEITGFLIFLFGNLGMRFLGIVSFISLLRKSLGNYFNQIFLLITLISFILPLLFLQKGVASNTIQFLQYFLLLSGVLAALTISNFITKIRIKVFRYFLIILIVLLSAPTQIGLLYDFYNRPPLAKISSEEIQALNFLKKTADKNSVILTSPYNKYLDLKTATPDIWAWSDSSYVSAFSERRTYLADTEQVDITGYDFKDRLKFQQSLFDEVDEKNILPQLVNHNINYLYFPKLLRPKANLDDSGLKLIYSNSKIEIWRIK